MEMGENLLWCLKYPSEATGVLQMSLSSPLVLFLKEYSFTANRPHPKKVGPDRPLQV